MWEGLTFRVDVGGPHFLSWWVRNSLSELMCEKLTIELFCEGLTFRVDVWGTHFLSWCVRNSLSELMSESLTFRVDVGGPHFQLLLDSHSLYAITAVLFFLFFHYCLWTVLLSYCFISLFVTQWLRQFSLSPGIAFWYEWSQEPCRIIAHILLYLYQNLVTQTSFLHWRQLYLSKVICF